MTTLLIAASAGTGKTHTICDVMAQRLTDGLDPARLVATTFTRKAATELAERIRARIQESTDLEGRREVILDRLDLAAIGTVHGIAHRFLCRHALRLGLSPRLTVLDEGEDSGVGSRHLEKLLHEQQPTCWEAFSEVCRRLGILKPHEVALEVLQAARSNAIPSTRVREDMQASVERWSAVVGQIDPQFRGIECAKELAQKAMQRIANLTDKTKTTTDALTLLGTIARQGIHTWGEVAKLAKMKAGISSGADNCLDDLRALGRGVRSAPGLHDDLRTFARLVGEVVEHLDQTYVAYKQERGLVDFVDLEYRFLELVRDPAMGPTLAAEIGCLVVDEFQDTNPMQLAIFRALQALAGETIWVGDRKQAIFGFRGADSRLIDGVWKTLAASTQRLETTYRNAPAIVSCVNALFGPVFGAEAHVTSKRTDHAGRVECWTVAGNKDATMQALAGGIALMMQEQPTLRRRNVAVLVRANHRAHAVAAALQQAGIAAVVPLPGLLQTREGAVVLAGLRLLADRNDSLAGAELRHLLETDPTQETPAWFHERLAEVAAGGDAAPFAGVANIEAVAAVAPAHLAAPDVVLAVIAALNLPGHIPGWGDPAGRLANLDALVALAQGYEDDARRDGRPATVSGLVRYLGELQEDERDTIPVAEGSDAVHILTYHKSKGLEWPVTICFDLDASSKPRLFGPMVAGGDSTAADPLQGRRLRYWPWPFGFNPQSHRPNDYGSGLEGAALATDEGQASEAAQRDEDHRLLYVGCTRARDLLVLVLPEKKAAWLDGLGDHVAKVKDSASGLVHHRECLALDITAQVSGAVSWIAEPPTSTAVVSFPPRSRAPSGANMDVSAQVVETHSSGAAVMPLTGTVDAAVLGSALHAYFAGVVARAHLDPSIRTALAEEALRAWNVGGCLPAAGIAARADAFLAWMQARWPGATLLTEVPVDGLRSDGGQWMGTIDALVVSTTGVPIAVIDHKTTDGPSAQPEDALVHAPQLAAYREAIGHPVEVWVHQVPVGRLVRLELADS